MFSTFFFQIQSLKEPYGDCEDTIPVPQCRLQHKAERIMEECGCVSYYMEQFINNKDKYISSLKQDSIQHYFPREKNALLQLKLQILCHL